MDDESKSRLRVVENAIFGDRENPTETPGLISDIRCMRIELGEVSSSMKKIVWLVFMMFLTAVGGFVFKGVAGGSDLPPPSNHARP